ncbi:putative colanic acid biosynthesis acetyltransferase [Pyruvatibacter sp.]
MGNHATLGRNSNCYNMGKVRLGSHAIVSQSAYLCGGTHDVDDINFQLHVGEIDIGDFAWVASEAFVGPGVTLGEGAVLGARGVAFKNVPAWKIYGGNPAAFLRDRLRQSGSQLQRAD